MPRLLLAPFEHQFDKIGHKLMSPEAGPSFDFGVPAGEPALTGPDSVSWRIFKNPVSLFIGGVAAVILELAEPSVRSGVWEHSSFRKDPVGRLQRTGMAAMITVYGARSQAEKMIAGVVRRHDGIRGTTPHGQVYHANDPELLDWVQATATFGFASAYDRYVWGLSTPLMSRAFAEAREPGRLYGAMDTPASLSEWETLYARMLPRLEPSPIVFEFLELISDAEAFPSPLRPLQRMMVRGAVALVPASLRARLGLGDEYQLRLGEARVLKAAGRISDRLVLRSLPPARACQRLGLPADYLYRPAPASRAA